MIKITVNNPIYAKIEEDRDKISSIFAYKDEVWIKTPFGKRQQKMVSKSMIGKDNTFYSGLIDRIKREQPEAQIDYSPEYTELEHIIQPKNKSLPKNKSFGELREEQKRIVDNCISKRKGIVVGVTGIGKSIIISAILKQFEHCKCLLIVPTISLMYQMNENLQSFKFKHVGLLGDSHKDVNSKMLISTIQSFSSLDLDKQITKWDVVLIDECHLSSDKDSSIEKIMSKLIAPVRIGFTGTYPKDRKRDLILTGLFGSIIDTVSYDEANERNIIVKPSIKLIPTNEISVEGWKYQEWYKHGIVNNKSRNEQIVTESEQLYTEGKSHIIFVKEIEHGNILLDLLEKKNVKCEFVWGEIKGTDRDIIKDKLRSKELLCVIASTVFVTGIDIKSLNAIILGGGGKSETALLQGIGRVLRTDVDKEEGLVIDFIDRGKFYLADHFCQRLSKYIELGWEIK